MSDTARIIFLDIETAPNLGYVWGKWQQNVIEFEKDWYILSFAYKVYGQKDVHVHALPDYPAYKKDREDDSQLVKSLWHVMDQADIIVAHNGDDFDLKKSNTRFLTHNLPPPSLYKTVDTLKIARKVFAFDSNKLDELCKYLSIGRKLPHTGFHLWKSCMLGDKDAWETMKEYNAHDITLLEEVYERMKPWHNLHPNVNQGVPITSACPKCGSTNIQKRGFSYTRLSQIQRYRCSACTGWFEGSAHKVR